MLTAGFGAAYNVAFKFIVGAVAASALNDNRAKTEKGRKQQDKESINYLGQAAMMYASGIVISRTFEVASPLLKEVGFSISNRVNKVFGCYCKRSAKRFYQC